MNPSLGRPTAVEGLEFAFVLDGEGGGQALEWSELEGERPPGAFWAHLDRSSERVSRWIREKAGLDEHLCEALLAEDTRPRAQLGPKGGMLVLRAINLNHGEEPEDMVSVRIWIDEGRLFTLRLKRIYAVDGVAAALCDGKGPKDTAGLLAAIAHSVLDRVEPVLDELEERTDGIEDALFRRDAFESGELAELRLELAVYLRHLRPQRDALQRLASAPSFRWLGVERSPAFIEAVDRVTRIEEDLASLGERAQVVQDEYSGRQTQELNHRMFVVSVATALFLPLGLLTGLLGINVAGIPLADSSLGFAVVCVLLVAFGALEYWFLRRKHWL